MFFLFNLVYTLIIKGADMNLLLKLFLIFIILLLTTPVFSLEEENSDSNFGMVIELGAETFIENDETVAYQMLSLNPDFSFGKIGIGLALTFHYRFDDGEGNFDFREEDWILKKKDERTYLDIYLPIIKYVRYGQKGDDIYAKLGFINNATLGNGFIMGNYSNTNFLPELRMVGLAFDLDGNLFNFPYIGVEFFSGNLAKMDVFGGRLYVRPLISQDIPIIKNLQIGLTVAYDREPDALYDFIKIPDDPLTEYTPDTVSIYGVDFKQPVISNSMVSLIFFGDAAFQKGDDSINTGGMIGIGGQFISFLNYGMNILLLGDNFVPFYFDSAYDLYREHKYTVYSGAAKIKGYTGWLASLGVTFLDGMFKFNTSVDGAFDRVKDEPTTYPHLRSVLVIGEGLLPGVFFDISYDKRYIENWPDFIEPENAVIGININYKTGPAVITLGYNLRYVPDALPGENEWETTAKLSTSISF